MIVIANVTDAPHVAPASPAMFRAANGSAPVIRASAPTFSLPTRTGPNARSEPDLPEAARPARATLPPTTPDFDRRSLHQVALPSIPEYDPRRRRRRGRRRDRERPAPGREPCVSLLRSKISHPVSKIFPPEADSPWSFGRERTADLEPLHELDEFEPGAAPRPRRPSRSTTTISKPRRARRPRTTLRRPTRKSTPSSNRKSSARSTKSPSSSARWAFAARPKPVLVAATSPLGPGRSTRGRGLAKPPIQEIFRRGDEVLVQVIKESIGTKGPTLSTYISIPGRYLVLMPGLNRVGVSRKIVDEGQRTQAPRDHERAQPSQGARLHRQDRRPRTHQARARSRSGLSAQALEGHPPADQEVQGTHSDLSRIGHDHPDHPRYLQLRDRHDLDRRAGGLRTRPGLPQSRHAALRQSPQALRRKSAPFSQVRHRGRDRQDPAPACAPSRRRLDRDRPDRGPGGHRRQLGQLPGRGRRRANGLRNELAGRQGNRADSSGSAIWAA